MKITVLEYERLLIKQHRDEQLHYITSDDAMQLQNIFVGDVPAFVRRDNYVAAQQWVGVVDLKGLSIEVLPKISFCENFLQCRKILINMLCSVDHVTLSTPRETSISVESFGFRDLMIYNYIVLLEQYVKSSLLLDYVRITKTQPLLRGKIDFRQQFNRPEEFPTKFRCTYSKYLKDNNINRLLLCALNQMLDDTQNAQLRYRIKKLLLEFTDIQAIPRDIELKLQISFNSVNAKVQSSVCFAQLYLKNLSTGFNAGKQKAQVMLFDMSKLYEQYIYCCYRKIYGIQVNYQYAKKYLVKSTSGRKYVLLRPDIVLKRDTGLTILDTKWKRIHGFAKESDIYQMNAYGTSFDGCRAVYLLYPYDSDSSAYIGDYSFELANNTRQNLRIRLVDLSISLNWPQFRSHLISLVE